MNVPKHWWTGCGVLAAYLALAIAFTWPLALQLNSAVPHDLGDPLGFTWIFWWNAQATPLTDAWLNAPLFYPSPGAIVFQDSMVGVWPITTGLQWLGVAPLAVHNVLLIGSFALSAFTAFLLCSTLFGDRRAAFAGGLVYGFAIFRAAQIPHLNILLTYWLPLVFLGLHVYLSTRKWRWLLFAAICWGLQGLTSGYFIFYGTVLVGLWALFFFRGGVTDYLRCAAAFGLVLVCMWPWLSMYRSVHQAYGFHRAIGEMEVFSADVMGLLRAPPFLTIWGPWLGYDALEDQLFPGLILAGFSIVVVLSSRYWSAPRFSRLSIGLATLAVAFAVIASISAFSPTTFGFFGVQVSLTRPYKPLSGVWISLLAAMCFSPPVVRVFRDRSVPGFYALAALALWILSLGPTVKFLGHRLWYKAPYAWLLSLPGADTVRVPARLWLLVLLALAVLTAYGLAKLARTRGSARSGLVTAVVCIALVIEAWPGSLEFPRPPERIAALESAADRVPVLELPLDSAGWNTAAMYRAMFHRRPLVNGHSGYEPPLLAHLRVGLQTGDARALTPLVERTALDIVIHAPATAAGLVAMVERAGANLITKSDRFSIYRLAHRPAVDEPMASPAGVIASAHQDARGVVTQRLADEDPDSFVDADDLEITLAKSCAVDEVQIGASPGLSSVTVLGNTGSGWQDLGTGSVAEQSVRAALVDPYRPRLRLRFAPIATDRLRIKPHGASEKLSVVIASLGVFGRDCGR